MAVAAGPGGGEGWGPGERGSLGENGVNAPSRFRGDRISESPIGLSLDEGQHRLDRRLCQQVWLEAEVEQHCVSRVVVVIF